MSKPDLIHVDKAIPYFRYWVQKSIPAVYDDSLSYYELLSKVIKHLNDIGELTNSMIELWNDVVDWILDEGLAVEVIKVLNEWYDNGKLADIINDEVFGMKADKTTIAGTVNVEDFPREEGETTDTPRIQRAIDSLGQSTLGTGKLIFADKEYIIDDSITFDTRGLILEGKGLATVLKNYMDDRAPVIKSWQSDRSFSPSLRSVQIKDMTIHGNQFANGISLSGFNYNCSIENVRFFQCKRALEISNSWGFRLDKIFVEYCENGVILGDSNVDPTLSEHVVNSMTIDESSFVYCEDVGIECSYVKASLIKRCNIEKCGKGIYFNRENRITSVENCYIEDNIGGGIVIGNPLAVVPRDLTIRNNWLYELTDATNPIHIYRANGLTVKGNKYYKLGMQDHQNPIKIHDDDPGNISGLILADVTYVDVVGNDLLNSVNNIFTKPSNYAESTNLMNGATGTIRYWRDSSGTVHVEGRNITCEVDVDIFTLPSTMRPQDAKTVAAITISNGAFPIDISSVSGAIRLRGVSDMVNGNFQVSYRGSTKYNG